MTEKVKSLKASEDQKLFLLQYMEDNLDFAHDKFESDRSYLIADKWRALALQLNFVGGAVKDPNQWRKFWRDQKLHVQERAALNKASFDPTGVNSRKRKELSEFDQRVLALLVPPKGVYEQECIATMQATENSLAASEKDSEDIFWIDENPEISLNVSESPSSSSSPTPRKRKRDDAEKPVYISYFEKKILAIKEEKLKWLKQQINTQESYFEWKKTYKEKLLELKEREIIVREKELESKLNIY